MGASTLARRGITRRRTTTARTPSSLSGLVRWLRADDVAGADGAAITAWADRVSGTATGTATIRRALFGGQDCVRFSGSQTLAYPSATWHAAYTLFAVFRHNTYVTNAGPIGMDSYTMPGRVIQFRNTSTTALQLITFDTAGSPMFDTVPATNIANPSVATIGHTATSNELWWNGSSNGSTAITGTTHTGPGVFVIGGSSGTTDQRLNGDVAEVILYNRALTATERAYVHSYLQDRYGITVTDYVAP